MKSREESSPTKKIRVLHLINIDTGIRIHLLSQLLYLQEQGFDVAGACSPGENIPADGVTEDGIPVKTINMTRQISPFKDLLALYHLYQYFRAEEFDIVHTHSLKPGLLGRIAAFLAQTPIRLHTIHGFRFHDNMSPLARRFYIWMERIGNWFGQATLSQGELDIELAIKEKICKPNKIFYLGNGVSTKQFTTPFDDQDIQRKKAELGIEPTDKIVGIVGRQTKIKGYLEFIKAARIVSEIHPHTKFITIGPVEEGNPDALDLPELIHRYHLEDTVLSLGRRQDMRELYGIMDIMTLPSWLEGVPRVLIEASMCGVPIIATDIPGNREVVQHDFNGKLIPVGDEKSLAQAIIDLLEDEKKAQFYGQNGKQRSISRFNEQSYFGRLMAVYDDLLNVQLPEKYDHLNYGKAFQ